ncbi:hypothetical protein [Synechococcus sp. CBW1006]|uniref:hypothetical protein n=1 Tax=Synechococcus sp. CBW1006 TaxID=1353138 RepID=UPI0018CDF515|nr:hypothetical protein [Synechococcus sp. CBW1006]QPN67387.1 hypothetical protein H8F26_03980 [Synechococcus sp. CBW1006]
MSKSVHLFLDERSSGNVLRRDLTIECFDNNRSISRDSIYYEFFGHSKSTANLDFAIVAILFASMKTGRDIYVHGSASQSLMRNLEEFQHVFCSWFPNLYQCVDINADHIEKKVVVDTGQSAVLLFSGGVDSCFSLFKHVNRSPGKYHVNIDAAVLVHGFDIRLEAQAAFDQAAKSCRKILAATNIPLVCVKTNARLALPDWEQNFAAAFAGVLHQFNGSHSIGILSSDARYDALTLPWGSNPISDHMLSSDIFSIMAEGHAFSRTEKVMHISETLECVNNLRVCWEGPQTGANCCVCEKCIRTILNFRAAGKPLPSAFEKDITDEQIMRLGDKLMNVAKLNELVSIYTFATKHEIAGTWLETLQKVISKQVATRSQSNHSSL